MWCGIGTVLDGDSNSNGEDCVARLVRVQDGVLWSKREDLPAVRIQTIPTQASQLILPSVRMLARQKMAMAATATKTAVQVPCSDKAFNAMDMLSIADPATKIQSDGKIDVSPVPPHLRLSKNISNLHKTKAPPKMVRPVAPNSR